MKVDRTLPVDGALVVTLPAIAPAMNGRMLALATTSPKGSAKRARTVDTSMPKTRNRLMLVLTSLDLTHRVTLSVLKIN